MNFINFFFKKIAAKRKGKTDGKNLYPPVNFDGQNGSYSDYEKSLTTQMNTEIQTIFEIFKNREDKITQEIQTLELRLDMAIENLKNVHTKTKEKFNNTDNVVIIEPIKRYKNYLIIFIIIIILEGSLNFYTFRYLREPGLTTLIIGAILTISLPISGHVIGYNIKPKDKKWFHIILGIILSFICISLIYLVAQGREIMLAQKIHDEKTLNLTFFIFVIFNLIFFIASIYKGYEHSYNYLELHEAYKNYHNRTRQFNNRIQRLKSNFNRIISKIKKTVNDYNELANVYRRKNRLTRLKKFPGNPDKSKVPLYFEKDFQIMPVIPEEIKNYYNSLQPYSDYEKFLNEKFKNIYDKINNFNDYIKQNSKLQ